MRAFLRRLLHAARRRRHIAIWTAGLAVIALVIAAAYSPFSPLDRLNSLVFDTYQKLRPRVQAESAVAVVDIDDESIRRLGQWPWSRTVLASMIDRLTADGAAAIGLDIVFSEPDRTSPALAVAQLESQGFQITYPGSTGDLDHDKALAPSFARSPVVAGLVLSNGLTTAAAAAQGGFCLRRRQSGANICRPFRARCATCRYSTRRRPGLACSPFRPAEDGVVRQIPLVFPTGRQFLSGAFDRVAEARAGRLHHRHQEHRRQRRVRHRTARHDRAEGRRRRGSDRAGRPDLGLLHGGAHLDGHSGLSAARRPDPELASQIEGRIVLIGTSAVGLRDLVATPLRAAFPGRARPCGDHRPDRQRQIPHPPGLGNRPGNCRRDRIRPDRAGLPAVAVDLGQRRRRGRGAGRKHRRAAGSPSPTTTCFCRRSCRRRPACWSTASDPASGCCSAKARAATSAPPSATICRRTWSSSSSRIPMRWCWAARTAN